MPKNHRRNQKEIPPEIWQCQQHVYLSLLLGEDPGVLTNEAQRIVDAFLGIPPFYRPWPCPSCSSINPGGFGGHEAKGARSFDSWGVLCLPVS